MCASAQAYVVPLTELHAYAQQLEGIESLRRIAA